MKDGIQLRDNAMHDLLQIKDLESGLTYLNKIKSIEVWVKAEKKDAELQNIVAEQKLRTQRILGQLIQDGQRNGEIASQNNGGANIPNGLPQRKTVDEIGLSHKQSSTFQQIANIPEQTFENYIKEKKEAVNNAVAELTTTGAVKLAKSLKENINVKKTNYESDNEEIINELVQRINQLPKIDRLKIKQRVKW